MRERIRRRLRRGNAPFLLFVAGLAAAWYGRGEGDWRILMAGTFAMTIAYAWQNFLWLKEE